MQLAQSSDLRTGSWPTWNSEPFSAKTAFWHFQNRETPRIDGTVMLTLYSIFVPGLTLIQPFLTNQPTKDLTEDGDLRFAQVDVPRSI